MQLGKLQKNTEPNRIKMKNDTPRPTPTPRTDAQINGRPCTQFSIMAGDSLRDALVKSEFARQLERELTAMTERRDGLAKQIEANHKGTLMLEQMVYDAREQRDRLAEALQKLADCDWVITLPDRMDAVRTIANEALQSLTPTQPEPK
jgi:hypothetical protein